jgi:Endonuclease V
MVAPSDELRTAWKSEQEKLLLQLDREDDPVFLDAEPEKTGGKGEKEAQERAFPRLRRVGGVDISFVKGSETRACASLVVLSFPELEIVYERYKMVELTAPYIRFLPSSLSFSAFLGCCGSDTPRQTAVSWPSEKPPIFSISSRNCGRLKAPQMPSRTQFSSTETALCTRAASAWHATSASWPTFQRSASASRSSWSTELIWRDIRRSRGRCKIPATRPRSAETRAPCGVRCCGRHRTARRAYVCRSDTRLVLRRRCNSHWLVLRTKSRSLFARRTSAVVNICAERESENAC